MLPGQVSRLIGNEGVGSLEAIRPFSRYGKQAIRRRERDAGPLLLFRIHNSRSNPRKSLFPVPRSGLSRKPLTIIKEL